jgi:glycosyltransferase involved in cell wall biosynthesis
MFGFAQVITLRPVIPSETKPSLSVIIPARDEKGNIENALKQFPKLEGVDCELVFIEGHSADGTWSEILRVKNAYSTQFDIKAFRQPRKGKSDAVRFGFSKARGDLLTILDADLTVPPEQLERFYEAYCTGLSDFVNGSRLVYPMEGKAMQYLNRLGNVFFAKILSYILDTKISDSLCGTKLLSRHDYQRAVSWRKDFGDFDPFGDFELLFPAAILSMGIVDIPVRYLDRQYGSTSISRFRHGLQLLRMVWIGFCRIKMGKSP